MKKLYSVLLAAVLLFALASSALAADFTPSVEQKGAPGLPGVIGSDEEPHVAVVEDEGGSIIYNVPWGDLVLTAYSQRKSAGDPEITARLESTYSELNESGSLAEILPDIAEQLPPGYTPEDLVVTDIFDLSAYGTCAEYLAVPGNTITVGFTVSVSSQDFLLVMLNAEGGWTTLDTVRDGNTVYVTFDSLGVVAFATLSDAEQGGGSDSGESGGEDAPRSPKTADMSSACTLCGLSLIAVGAALLLPWKKKKSR